jgi:transcriptional regulator with XRE-family HTH domain
MGKYARRKQARLAEKLRHIRTVLGFSQNELLKHLGLEEELYRTNISSYESGEREPHLYVLLRYAHAAGVCLDLLVDDDLDLPEKMPSVPHHRAESKPKPRTRGKR